MILEKSLKKIVKILEILSQAIQTIQFDSDLLVTKK